MNLTIVDDSYWGLQLLQVMIPQVAIDVIGWIYFAAWSLSFYGQLGLNFRLKNVEGMNFDFLAMNLTGFTFYSLYCSYGYFSGNDQQTGKVDLNDVIFSYHALAITIVTVIQAFVYPQGKNKILKVTIGGLSLMWIFCIVYSCLSMEFKVFTPSPRLGVISFMGYFKLVISFLKYLPQFYWNYQRKSTKGWSIMNIMLDFTGGFFSFLQMVLERVNGPIEINGVKLALAILCMIYDALFMFQHYVLYRNPPAHPIDVDPSNSKIIANEQEIGASFADEADEKNDPLIVLTH